MGISGSNVSFSRKFIQAFSFHPAGKQLNAGAVSKKHRRCKPVTG
jgi:hypothetical protein